MNRGFCGADNINLMYKNHVKFLMSVSNSLSYAETSSKRSGLRTTVMSAITVTSAFMSLPRQSGGITSRRGPIKTMC